MPSISLLDPRTTTGSPTESFWSKYLQDLPATMSFAFATAPRTTPCTVNVFGPDDSQPATSIANAATAAPHVFIPRL